MVETMHQDCLCLSTQIFVQYKFLAIQVSMIGKDSKIVQSLTSLKATIMIPLFHLDFGFVPDMQKVGSCPDCLSHQMLSELVCLPWFPKFHFSELQQTHLLEWQKHHALLASGEL